MWKTCYVTLLAILFLSVNVALATESATDKGSILVSGTAHAGFSTQSGDLYENNDGDGQTTISFYPSGMYFFMPNLAIGGTVGFENRSWGDWSETTISIGPKVAYFFNLDSSPIHPYVAGSFRYMSCSWDTGTTDGTDDGFAFSGSGGAMLMVGDHVGLTGEVVFTQTSITYEGADESISGTTIGVRFGVIGFIFSE